MTDFDELKSLWKTEGSNNILKMEQIERSMRQFSRNKKKKNSLGIVLVALVLIALIIFITDSTYELWTSYFGLALLAGIVAGSLYLRATHQNKLSKLETLSNHDFLQTLEKEEYKTCMGKAQNQARLFIAYIIGAFFFLYESASDSLNYLLAAYGILLLFLLFAWFVIRPISAKFYQRDIQKTITHIRRLQSQMQDEMSN